MLYERVKKLCEYRKITISQLEKECNFSNATIRRWETSSPNVNSLERVADYFDVSIDFLLGRKNYAFKEETTKYAKRFDALDPEKKKLANTYMDIVEMQ